MKKMLLLLVSGLLITCMAGSAIAATDENLLKTGTSNDVVVIPPNSQTTINLDLRADNIYIPSYSVPCQVTITISAPGFKAIIPAEGLFKRFTLNERTVYAGHPFSKRLTLPETQIRTLTIQNTGATGPGTLTVTVDDKVCWASI